MEPIQWKAEFLTGDESIDEQHKELIRLANLLMDAAARGGEKAVIKAAYQALFRYTEKHFVEEEEYWRDLDTELLDSQRLQHQTLKQELASLWTNESLSFKDVPEDALRKWVVERLLDHFMVADQAAVEAAAKGGT